MAEIRKPVRLVNPGGVKKRLTLRQKLFFGSKKQRVAARASLRGRKNPSTNRKYKKAVKSGNWTKAMHYNKSQTKRISKRKYGSGAAGLSRGLQLSRGKYGRYGSHRLPNVGEIITIRPLISNGSSSTVSNRNRNSTKRRNTNKMAKSQKRRLAGLKAARTRKRRMSARKVTSHRRRSNPGVIRRRRRVTRTSVVHHRRRRSNPGVARRRVIHRRRRSNPGMLSGGGDFGKAVQIIGGAMLTSFLSSSFLPASFSTGIPGYIGTALIAMLQGKAVSKLLKNPSLGNNMAIGGYVYLALKIAKDYFPFLGLPFSLNGMGLIGGSSFYVPQVPMANNMGSFQLPGQVSRAMMPAAVAGGGGMRGLGNTRRVGRMR